ALLKVQIEIFGPHARQVGEQDQFLLALDNVHARRERCSFPPPAVAVRRDCWLRMRHWKSSLMFGCLIAAVGQPFQADTRQPGATEYGPLRHEFSPRLRGYSLLTGMRRGLTRSLLGKVRCKTPCSKRACTLSAWTSHGRTMVRLNGPKPRSRRC